MTPMTNLKPQRFVDIQRVERRERKRAHNEARIERRKAREAAYLQRKRDGGTPIFESEKEMFAAFGIDPSLDPFDARQPGALEALERHVDAQIAAADAAEKGTRH